MNRKADAISKSFNFSKVMPVNKCEFPSGARVMMRRVPILWVALIACCIAPLHPQAGAANAEAPTLSQDESDAIHAAVGRVSDGMAFVEARGKDVISSIKPYAGVTPFGGNRVECEVFPTLGVFRVRGWMNADDEDWLYIAWLKKDAPVVARKDADDSDFELSNEAREAILAVGSGVARADLQNAVITCAESKVSYVHFSRKPTQNESRVILIEALARKDGGSLEVEAVAVDRCWRSTCSTPHPN